MTIPGKTDYLLKFHLSQDIIICTDGGSRTHNLWIRSPTRSSIPPRRHMCCGMIGFSIYISCYNFPIIIAYFNCILKIYSSENKTWLPWLNWLARSAVNRKVGGSSPPCYNFPIIIAYFNCILKIYSSENIRWLPWRNWLAGSDFLPTQHIHLHTFLHDHYFGSYGCLNTIDRRKTNY